MRARRHLHTPARIEAEAREVQADVAALPDPELRGLLLAGLREVAERTYQRQATRLVLGLAYWATGGLPIIAAETARPRLTSANVGL